MNPPPNTFPVVAELSFTRHRRLRQQSWLRTLTAENQLTPHDFILPLFVQEEAQPTAIATLPDVYRLPIKNIIETAQQAWDLGIQAIALFPVTPPALKCHTGKEAFNENNLICRTIAAVKAAVPEIGIICDVALDPYTSHGHDGVLNAGGHIDNDATVTLLCQQALTLAAAGADMLAPSDMMDGRIIAIRKTLDANHYSHLPIISYAAKYASAFYGPFRDAVGSKGLLQGDKKTYQMLPHNSHEAARELNSDVLEGADILMIKPALPYLDIINLARRTCSLPIFTYQVSGEYAMLKFAAQAGAIDYNAALLESLLCCKRAGASGIFTYGAIEAAKLL